MQKINFTMIPNEIIDEHLNELSGAEIKILLAISRKTIGWHKDTDWICNQQMMDITGLSEPTVIKAVRGLLKIGLILKEKAGKPGKERLCYELDFDEGVKKVKGGGKETLPDGLNNVTHKINTTKETPKIKNINIVKGDWDAVKEYYENKLKSLMDDPYVDWGLFTKMVNPIFKQWGKDKTIKALEGFFFDSWIQNAGYPLGAFKKDPNRYLGISKYDPKVGLGVDEYLEHNSKLVKEAEARATSTGLPEELREDVRKVR